MSVLGFVVFLLHCNPGAKTSHLMEVQRYEAYVSLSTFFPILSFTIYAKCCMHKDNTIDSYWRGGGCK